ncbi:PREDICTED: pentatricopeptide repeat-containing protein At2g15980-like [Camelina sativa]|uniref:Pentatricopeptide repeat-containing protein At2g15980-like n=1 Tax=Camelina sativa TaxID=90675 RepID=A0ABM0ZKK2_CAMSA|nr:PREDICTED: pentatricopeptide repeat-containing protein At2g15980-like [Camelina sativa]
MIIKRIIHPTRKPKPGSIALFTTVSSPASPPPDPLISDAVSILTHHRSKSRWSTLRSLHPYGFTPSQFSEITLRLRNNPHLSLRFFLFTRRFSLCSHDVGSCSTLIHILARSRLKSHASEVIRLALRLADDEDEDEDRVLKLFRSLIKSYNRCGSAPFVFDLLVKSCLDSKEIDGAVMVMRKLSSRGISLQISTCNALVSEVSRRRGASNGYKMYREVFGLDDVIKVDEGTKKRLGKVKPNANTFNSMMMSFYREGETEMVERIWREMEDEVGCSPNGYSYCVLMEAYCARGLMSGAEKIWEEMKVKGVVFDVVAYNTMIGGLCSNLEVKKANELFREMGLKGIECTSLTYEHLVNGYCKVGDVESALVVYREMKRKSFEAEGLTIEALVDGLCGRDRDRVVEAAEMVKDAVRESEFYPSRKCYELLIKRLCEEGMMERALNIQAEMVGKGFKPSQETYRAFIDGYGIAVDEKTSALLAIEMAESLKLRAEEES